MPNNQKKLHREKVLLKREIASLKARQKNLDKIKAKQEKGVDNNGS
ncbi:MAG: hypothetical protein P8I94_03335 [Emcibacteraceae bacterium]|nr:hypothetical protein [Emcibacteraceae bacterium]